MIADLMLKTQITGETAVIPDKVWSDFLQAAHDRAQAAKAGRDFLATCTARSQLLTSASIIGFASHAYGNS